MSLKIKRKDSVKYDRSASSCTQLFGCEPIAITCVLLKGHAHLIHLTRVKIPDEDLTAFIDEITEGGGLKRLVQLLVTALDYTAGYRKGPKQVIKRAAKSMPLLLAGIIRESGAPFSLIRVGEINTATDHAPLRFATSDATTAECTCSGLRTRQLICLRKRIRRGCTDDPAGDDPLQPWFGSGRRRPVRDRLASR